jgi:hypothetical protein
VHRNAAGTLISRERDMSDALMTSIVLKTNVTLMDIVSTRMLGQYGFLAKVSCSLCLHMMPCSPSCRVCLAVVQHHWALHMQDDSASIQTWCIPARVCEGTGHVQSHGFSKFMRSSEFLFCRFLMCSGARESVWMSLRPPRSQCL